MQSLCKEGSSSMIYSQHTSPRSSSPRIKLMLLFIGTGIYSISFIIWCLSTHGLMTMPQFLPVDYSERLERMFAMVGGYDDSNDKKKDSNTGLTVNGLKCIGWRRTASCDPDGKVLSNRSCGLAIRGGQSGYCLLQNVTSGEEMKVMRSGCLSVRANIMFTCNQAMDFVQFANETNTIIVNATKSQHEHAQISTDVITKVRQNNTESAIKAIPAETNSITNMNATDGIVMVVYPKLLVSAYATIRVLRSLNCSLPIELWYLESEMGGTKADITQLPVLATLLEDFGPISLHGIANNAVTGFNSKVYAIAHTKLTNVLFLDADNVPVKNPTYLFQSRAFLENGALFWPDFWHTEHTIFNIHNQSLIWELLDFPYVDMFEQESGQLLINKAKSQVALKVLQHFAFHRPSIFDRLKLVHGDKDLFRLAWLKTNTSFHMIQNPPGVAGTMQRFKFCGMTMVQYDPYGEIIFLHRNAKKLHGGLEAKPGAKHEIGEDTIIWTHLQTFQYEKNPHLPNNEKLDYAMVKQKYKIQIYNGAPQFDASQWCYGQKVQFLPRYKVTKWGETPFPMIESELLEYASQAAALFPNETTTIAADAKQKLVAMAEMGVGNLRKEV